MVGKGWFKCLAFNLTKYFCFCRFPMLGARPTFTSCASVPVLGSTSFPALSTSYTSVPTLSTRLRFSRAFSFSTSFTSVAALTTSYTSVPAFTTSFSLVPTLGELVRCLLHFCFELWLTLTIWFCFDSVLVVNVAWASQMVLNTPWTWRLQTLWANYVVRLTWSWSSERYPYRVPCGLRTFLVLSLLVVTTEEMACSRRPWERT